MVPQNSKGGHHFHRPFSNAVEERRLRSGSLHHCFFGFVSDACGRKSAPDSVLLECALFAGHGSVGHYLIKKVNFS